MRIVRKMTSFQAQDLVFAVEAGASVHGVALLESGDRTPAHFNRDQEDDHHEEML